MHPLATRSGFLRLRLAGLSFARIGSQLGVSKPTLIKWSRQSSGEANVHIAQQRASQEILASSNHELADLLRKLAALRQELFSRALQETPTQHLETIAGQFRQPIQHLESTSAPPDSSNSSSTPQPNRA